MISTGCALHSTSVPGPVTASVTQNPCRNVRRASRRTLRLRPIACAISGATAMPRPMPVTHSTKKMFVPSAPAAKASGPSHPISSTSVVRIATCASCVAISGKASVTIAPISTRQGEFRDLAMVVAMTQSDFPFHTALLDLILRQAQDEVSRTDRGL